MISILPGKRQRSSTKENAELWGTQVACGYHVGEETFHPEGGGEPRKAVSRGGHREMKSLCLQGRTWRPGTSEEARTKGWPGFGDKPGQSSS